MLSMIGPHKQMLPKVTKKLGRTGGQPTYKTTIGLCLRAWRRWGGAEQLT